MSLADEAANDWKEIMNDDLGASVSCDITSPAGDVESFFCRSSDTSQQVDPGSNVVVSGRQLILSVCISDLIAVGFEGIKGVEKKTEKPWKLSINDINDVAGEYKVVQSNPDASIGNMVLWLEVIK